MEKLGLFLFILIICQGVSALEMADTYDTITQEETNFTALATQVARMEKDMAKLKQLENEVAELKRENIYLRTKGAKTCRQLKEHGFNTSGF